MRLNELGFGTAFEVQEKTLPLTLDGRYWEWCVCGGRRGEWWVRCVCVGGGGGGGGGGDGKM